ncbi:hypothetical protein [Actinoplanes sp. NPDC049599]|uniref:hypothetical protein n=1 Tax=Actinoplanes sp. NPDC049599 TaxID=3363903 RepID=UPI0037A88764
MVSFLISPTGNDPDEAHTEEVSGFHRIIEGPSVQISAGSLLALPARVASAHELVHQFLTRNTTFGNLMQICSVLERAAPADVKHAVNLRWLAAQCRTTHESAATFESVWMVADGDLSVLAGSREYLSWYRDASEVVPFADHTRLKLLAVQRVVHACMSSPVLEHLVRLGPDEPAAWRMPSFDRPDRRLRFFHQDLPSDFWPETLQGCRKLLGDDLWSMFVPQDPSAERLTATFAEDLDPVVSRLASYLDQRIEGLASRWGFLVAEPSGATLQAAMEAVAEAVPDSYQRMRLQDDSTVLEETLTHVFSERVLLSAERRPARLMPLAGNLDIPIVYPADAHRPRFVYVVVRSASRLIDQYKFSPTDHERLLQYGDTVLTCVTARSKVEGEWFLLQICRSEEVALLATRLAGRADLHVNWSLAAMAAATRRDVAGRDLALTVAASTIAQAGVRLALVDAPILPMIQGWRKQHLTLRFLSTVLQVSGKSRLHLVAFRVDDKEDLVVVLCGEPQARTLETFLDSYYPGATRDTAVLPIEVGKSAMRSIALLLESEHVIDYRALIKP